MRSSARHGRLSISALSVLLAVCTSGVTAQVRLADESDRSAFRSWFVFLADAQFYRTTSDVIDCAALVRHAFREALRPHTPEWMRLARLPVMPAYSDVRRPPRPEGAAWPLFRVSSNPGDTLAEFADARTIVQLNSQHVGRDLAALRPGDLLYFRQPEQTRPDHLMIFVGASRFDEDASDWVVYHTGPLAEGGPKEGEVRKVRLADLLKHPSPRWRPRNENPRFVGVFRLALL
jgi:uncharacterized protein YfaT (DUF1175 family)